MQTYKILNVTQILFLFFKTLNSAFCFCLVFILKRYWFEGDTVK